MLSNDEHKHCTQRGNIVPASPLGHHIMFLVFTVVAFCLFAPTILLPVLQDHCELLAEEERLEKQCAELEREAHRQDALMEAFATDLTVNERLAVLDLHYKNPNEIVVPILSSDQLAVAQSSKQPEFQSILSIPTHWPKNVRKLERWADRRGLIELYLDPTLRPAFLLMAGGLIIAAFVLCAPRANRRDNATDVERTAVTPLG